MKEKDKEKRLVRFIAGTVVTLSVAGGWIFDERLYLLALLAGLNLFQSSVTGFCPPEVVYRKLNR